MADSPADFAQQFHDHTTLHPMGLAAVAMLGAALLYVHRRHATWPMIILACFIPTAQRVVLVGADFDLLRIMIIFGTVRVLTRREYADLRWTRLDTMIVAWAFATAFFPFLRAGSSIIVNRLGQLYDILGMYFLARCLLRNWDDLAGMVTGLMWISLPLACFFALERATGRNLFSVFGGVPEITVIRDEKLRCQGAFSHPILAGCFWAAALPLIAAQWWRGYRWLAPASCAAALFIVFSSNSATPVLGVITACIGAGFFAIRNYLRWVRWGLVATLVGLHMVMQAPVWHLLARTSSLGGSSWHRYALLNGAITHADEWWLIGSSVGTAHWGHWTFDVTNFYIVQAIQGGVIQLLLFIGILGVAFSYVGQLHRKVRRNKVELVMAWGIGVSLLVHATNHFGVTYFGQIWLSWYLLLGAIGSLYGRVVVKTAVASAGARASANGRRAAGRQVRARPLGVAASGGAR